MTIPAGTTVTIDRSTPALGCVFVEGTLNFAAAPVELTARCIVVRRGGLLEAGSEAAPHPTPVTVTLVGPPTTEEQEARDPLQAICGTKSLCVTGGGRLELHGARRDAVSWTRLDDTARPGATALRLAAPVRWTAGDALVVAPTGRRQEETERVTVQSVSVDGRTVTVTPPLQFEHWGALQTYAGKPLDERAEIGLLSRDIVIRSTDVDPNSTASGRRFGGHVIITGGGIAHVEGVRLENLGQETRLGRYAFHWHHNGPSAGQYFRSSSIENSFTRGVVIHVTDGVLVEANVVYKTHSHAFVFAEDGPEVGNVLRGNLAVLVEPLPKARTLVGERDDRFQDEHRPAGYWGRNADQVFIGNVAAATGAQGYHFIYTLASQTLRHFQFKDNSAHTLAEGGIFDYFPLTNSNALLVSTSQRGADGTLVFENFTAYATGNAGTWIDERHAVVRGAMIADAAVAHNTGGATVEDSVFVAHSANTATRGGLRRGILVRDFGARAPGPIIRARGVTFVGYTGVVDGPAPTKVAILIDTPDSALKDGSWVEKLSFSDSNTPIFFFRGTSSKGFFPDRDGSIAARAGLPPGAYAVQGAAGTGCTRKEEWQASFCKM